MMLKLTFTDGTTNEFPFHSGSQLTVATPDGVNEMKYGSWGEITHLELVDASDAPAAAPAPADVPDVSAPVDVPAAEPDTSAPPPVPAPVEVPAADPPAAGTEPDSGSVTNSDASTPTSTSTPPETTDPVVTDSAAGDVVSATPAEAVEVAALLPADDALKHVEAALVRWPDDADLLAAHADLLEKPAA